MSLEKNITATYHITAKCDYLQYDGDYQPATATPYFRETFIKTCKYVEQSKPNMFDFTPKKFSSTPIRKKYPMTQKSSPFLECKMFLKIQYKTNCQFSLCKKLQQHLKERNSSSFLVQSSFL